MCSSMRVRGCSGVCLCACAGDSVCVCASCGRLRSHLFPSFRPCLPPSPPFHPPFLASLSLAPPAGQASTMCACVNACACVCAFVRACLAALVVPSSSFPPCRSFGNTGPCLRLRPPVFLYVRVLLMCVASLCFVSVPGDAVPFPSRLVSRLTALLSLLLFVCMCPCGGAHLYVCVCLPLQVCGRACTCVSVRRAPPRILLQVSSVSHRRPASACSPSWLFSLASPPCRVCGAHFRCACMRRLPHARPCGCPGSCLHAMEGVLPPPPWRCERAPPSFPRSLTYAVLKNG